MIVPKVVQEVQSRIGTTVPEMEAVHISYSQLAVFENCPRQWYRSYRLKEVPYIPTIYTVFGTSMHETIQTWLSVLYQNSVKAAETLDLGNLLKANLVRVFKQEKAANGKSFSTSKEMHSFYEDGLHILNFIKKNRRIYFSNRGTYLVGVEIPLYYQLKPKVYFKGFIDLVLYDEDLDKWIIIDLKTSTRGWDSETKKNDVKISQLLLYKEFFSKQFNISLDKIEVKYIILKRKVPLNPEYAIQKRRLQEFIPASGPKKRKLAVGLVENFIGTTLSESGDFVEKEHSTRPSKVACKYCFFKENRLCPDAVL